MRIMSSVPTVADMVEDLQNAPNDDIVFSTLPEEADQNTGWWVTMPWTPFVIHNIVLNAYHPEQKGEVAIRLLSKKMFGSRSRIA